VMNVDIVATRRMSPSLECRCSGTAKPSGSMGSLPGAGSPESTRRSNRCVS
jgi:hypothetical protein